MIEEIRGEDTSPDIEALNVASHLASAYTIPCPDCGTTENRDYSNFLFWFAEPQRDMPKLLGWVKTQPCNQCAMKRHQQEKL